jgi:hypothetical protein
VFDAPDGRYTVPAFQKLLDEMTWRICSEVEHENPPSDPFGEKVTMPDGIARTYFAPKVVNLAFSSTVTPDASQGNMFYLTVIADCNLNVPVNGVDGQHITLELTSEGHSVTWGNGWDFGNAGIPVLSSAGKTDIVSAYYRETAASWRAGFTSGF